MVGRVDVPPEHLDVADRRHRPEVTGEVLVAEHHLLHGEPEPEGDDGEVHATGAECRDGEHGPDEDREGHTGQECELGRPVLLSHQPGRGEGAEPADRVLRERQLPGITGEHDDREDEHPDDQRGVHRGRPLEVEREVVEEQEPTDGDDEEPARHDAAPEVGEALEHMAAQRQRLAAHHEHHDDHEERQRPLETGRAVLDPERVVQERGDVTGVGQDLGLGDPERDATEQRQREGAEPADQRDRERRHRDDDREDGEAQPGVGCEQDAGEAGRGPADRPRHRGEEVR